MQFISATINSCKESLIRYKLYVMGSKLCCHYQFSRVFLNGNLKNKCFPWRWMQKTEHIFQLLCCCQVPMSGGYTRLKINSSNAGTTQIIYTLERISYALCDNKNKWLGGKFKNPITKVINDIGTARTSSVFL